MEAHRLLRGALIPFGGHPRKVPIWQIRNTIADSAPPRLKPAKHASTLAGGQAPPSVPARATDQKDGAMSWTIDYLQEADVVRVKTSGTMDLEQLKQMMVAALAEAARHGTTIIAT
jgi:hypothetical protein